LNHQLQILSGTQDRQTVSLKPGRYTIGRGDQAHIQIFSHQISRIHAEVIVEEDQVTVLDRGSANGTAVNGKFVTSSILKSGDKIMLGEVVIEYNLIGGGHPQTAPIRPQPFTPRPSAYIAATKVIADRLRPRALWPLFTSLFSLAFLLIAVFSGISYKRLIEAKLTQESVARAHDLVRYLAEKNREDLRLNNELLLDVDTVLKEKGVKQAYIVNAKGRTVAPVSRLNKADNDPYILEALTQNSDQKIVPAYNPNKRTYTFAHPIRTYDDKRGTYETIGAAKIVFSAEDAVGELPEANRLFILLVTAALGLALLLGWVMSKTLINPLAKLTERIHQWRSGQMTQKENAPFKDLEPLYDAVQRAIEESEQ